MKRNSIISTSIFFSSLLLAFFIIISMDIQINKCGFPLEVIKPGNIFEIFSNNLGVCILLIIGSGIVTIPLIFIQGIQLGALMGLWVLLGNNMGTFLTLTIPHCIFEIPALILSSSLGIKLFSVFKNYYFNNDISLKNYFKENKKSFLSVLILLIIAAIVECTITVRIFNSLI